MRAAVLAAALAASCAGSAQETSAPSRLDNTEWVRIDDSDAAPHNPTMRIAGATVNGYTGCRTFAGIVSQRGDVVRFDAAGARPGCNSAESAEAADDNFLSALAATRHLDYEGDELILLDASRRQLARFQNASPE